MPRSWLGCLSSASCVLFSHEIEAGENGNCLAFSGLDWKSQQHSIWLFTKVAQNQEVGKQPLPFDGRHCKELVAIFSPLRVGTYYFLIKGPISCLVVERLQLSRCNLLTNHWVDV